MAEPRPAAPAPPAPPHGDGEDEAPREPLPMPGIVLVAGIAFAALLMLGALATDSLAATPSCPVTFAARDCGVDTDVLASPLFLSGASMFVVGLGCAILWAARRMPAAEKP